MLDELKWAIGESEFDPDATRVFSEGSLRLRYEAVQVPQPARLPEPGLWQEEDARRRGDEEHARERELDRMAAEEQARRLAEESAHLAAVATQRRMTEVAAEAAQARPAQNGPALAPDAPERASTADDEEVMQQLRAQLAPMAASAERSSARWTVPRIVFREHWRLPAIGLAGAVLASAAILIAVSWLFEGSKPRTARVVLASEPVVSDGPEAPVNARARQPAPRARMAEEIVAQEEREAQAGMKGPVVDARTY